MDEFNRHDIPETVKNLIGTAVELGVYDLFEVYAAAVNHGSDWRALTDDICTTAFAIRHGVNDTHSRIVRVAEMVWKELATVQN